GLPCCSKAARCTLVFFEDHLHMPEQHEAVTHSRFVFDFSQKRQRPLQELLRLLEILQVCTNRRNSSEAIGLTEFITDVREESARIFKSLQFLWVAFLLSSYLAQAVRFT